MKVRLERALPTTAARLRALAAAFVLFAFVALIGRSLIGALEVNAEISRLRDENAALAAEAEAPGSAARRLTVAEEVRSPLDAWIEVLFGG
jgi:hypothetical protein